MKRACRVFLGATVALHLACAPTPRSDAAGLETRREALRDLAAGFSAAVVAASASGWAGREVEQLAELYTEEAILFPPRGPEIRGRDAIRNYWTRPAARRILDHAIQVERLDVDGSLAADHGTFTLTSQVGEAAPESATFRFVSVYRRGADGRWRKHLDTWW